MIFYTTKVPYVKQKSKKKKIKKQLKKACVLCRFCYNVAMKLLTTNTKLEKNIKLNYQSWGIHLSPANKSGFNVCKWASKGCKAACLDTSGMGNFSNVQAARIKKTRLFFEDKIAFLTQLKREITNAVKLAKKKELKPSFRFNLTSDIPWENVKLDGKSMMEYFPEVQFMDYTKSPGRMSKFLAGELPANYHLTFSRSEEAKNQKLAKGFLASGGNVAMVFRKLLPETFMGYKVINGDETDLRFLDGEGVIVGLVEKGLAKKDKSGFVIEPVSC